MSLIVTVEHFLLSEWLWSITWGIYHLPIALFIMVLLLKRYTSMRMVPVVLCSIFANLFSFIAFSLFVVGVLIFALGFEYAPTESFERFTDNVLVVCLALAGIYSFLQLIFFVVLNNWYSMNVRRVVFFSSVAQFIAALIVYFLLPLYY